MITHVEDYFKKGCGRCERFATPDCSARHWALGLAELRRICLGEGLTETAKWGHPTYMHAGRNIAVIGAFRSDFRLSFFDAALLKDEAGLLEKSGPNTQHPDMVRFTDDTRPTAMEPALSALLREAMGYAEAGIRPARTPQDLDLPEELTEAMDADPELAEAFHALTPGRQRSYVIHLNGAKASATRTARILKLRPHILAGKGVNER